MPALVLALIVAATAANGLLAGASLDQSIKQLPARHRLGAVAFSQYSRASDLGNGVWFYALLGVGAALLTIAAAVAGHLAGPAPTLPLDMAAALAVMHSFATSRAAPTNFAQLKTDPNDAAALAAIFDRFERWQTLRVILDVLSFGVMLWALVAFVY